MTPPLTPRRRLRLAALVAAPLVAASTLAGALPATALQVSTPSTSSSATLLSVTDVVVEWSVAPADEQGPDGRVSLRHAVDPGATVDDAIAVTNLGTQRAEFSVTAGDGVVGANGAFDVASGEPERSGAWIGIGGLQDGRLELDGGETRVLPVSVSVPAEATPGDHPAGIVVAVSEDQGGVTVTHRVGVRLHLQVNGELTPALEVREIRTSFSPSWLPFAPGTLRVDYEVANAGNVRLGASTAVSAAGPAGLVPVRAGDGVEELLPGDSALRAVEVSAWPLFALVGDVSITALAVGEDRVPLPAATDHAFVLAAVPWTGLAVLVLLVGGTVLLAVTRRRAARRRAEASAVALTTEAAPVPVGAGSPMS